MWRKDSCRKIPMWLKISGLRLYITDSPRERGRHWTYGFYLNSRNRLTISEFWVEPNCREPLPYVKAAICAKAAVVLRKPKKVNIDPLQLTLGICVHNVVEYTGEEADSQYCELGKASCNGCSDRK